MLEQMLGRYELRTQEEQHQALREVMQEIALAGLYRGGFFNKAAFYGGTCLRIFYQLSRYSEDLDFSLLEVDESFSIEPYLEAISDEFLSNGIEVEISKKNKTAETVIESAFLKNTTQVFDLTLLGKQPVKIKIEVDTKPPLGFSIEEKLLTEPFSFYVKCFQLPDLFAGKMHALLFRNWKNRVKGRDWYDLEWYIKKRVPLGLEHFNFRAGQSNSIDKSVNQNEFLELLNQKIETVDFDAAKQDIERFIVDKTELDIWSARYFKDLAEKLVFAL